VRLSTEQAGRPLCLPLTLHEPAGPRLVVVDLLETARLLLGLVPRRWRDGHRRTRPAATSGWRPAAAPTWRASVADPAPVLLWLRTVDDERDEAEAQAEYDWLVSQIPQSTLQAAS
jgi:adenine-specific DNA-methyltransferase